VLQTSAARSFSRAAVEAPRGATRCSATDSFQVRCRMNRGTKPHPSIPTSSVAAIQVREHLTATASTHGWRIPRPHTGRIGSLPPCRMKRRIRRMSIPRGRGGPRKTGRRDPRRCNPLAHTSYSSSNRIPTWHTRLSSPCRSPPPPRTVQSSRAHRRLHRQLQPLHRRTPGVLLPTAAHSLQRSKTGH